jgi:hypothetical protein
MMQFPWIRLETYGVPRAGEYYKNDSDRAFVKVPLNDSISEVSELVEKLKEIDAYFASEEFASKLLGKKWNKYTYQPIFREATVSQDDDDDDDDEDSKKKSAKKSNLPKFPYLKLKIDTEYGSGAIKTKLYRSEMSDGKRQRTEVTDMASVDDFARVVSFQSNFRPIVRLVKFWAQPLTKKDPTWGATFKIVKAEVEPSAKGNSMYKDYMNSDAFLDSDDEGAAPVSTSKKVETGPAKKVAQVESDDDSESEEESKPVVKQPAKKVAQVESDDDSESEEEAKPVAKQPAKKVAQVESDDDSEDEKPAPPAKKPAGKATGGRGGKAKSANA